MTENTAVPLYAGSPPRSSPPGLRPPPPPWRVFDRPDSVPDTFRTTETMVDAVNAALTLRRPLLVTGSPGTGKSSLIESVARQSQLGPVLRWPITSRSTVDDALYRYDVVGRVHAVQMKDESTTISDYMRLGPLGTALIPNDRPRALLIDEIDRGDIDLPNDLLNIFEHGEFEIKELARLKDPEPQYIRHADSDDRAEIRRGRVVCTNFPFIVMTSSGDREFTPEFLHRCIRLRMPEPTDQQLAEIVAAHLGETAAAAATDLIDAFLQRARKPGAVVATDQLMNAVYMVTQQNPGADARQRIIELILQELNSRTP
ncbi:AAA domain-containing protein [Nocardia sp. SYP-A9097]|uniref:AAA family ATPase n=1 Tax=Nocardia sp. SYP-A9097 TaxID=2663237 RepID=UPI00129AE69B|nr:MoxR family ATPase [Nocardia sp. SYP-A9097]MRH89608.1 AAA domain-containing protein [Nocardia sp. SYP-A9097]